MQMARLVAEGATSVPGTEVRVRSVEEATAEDVLWCEGIAVGSPTNMGVLFRCAAGLGMDAVLLTPACTDPLYRRSVRASRDSAGCRPGR